MISRKHVLLNCHDNNIMLHMMAYMFFFLNDMKIAMLNVFRILVQLESNRKAMNRNWSNQKANPALKTKAGNI